MGLIRLQSSSLPSGSVLQVKQTVLTSKTLIQTTGEQTITGASVSITPQSTNSKILITTAISGIAVGTNSLRFNLYRDATLVNNLGYYSSDPSYWDAFSLPFNYLDSPSTTSQITYQIKGEQQTSGGSAHINYANATLWTTENDSRSTITAMEIAG